MDWRSKGCFEVMPLPTAPADGADSVRLLNPLSSTEGHLRRRLLPGLVRLVEGNWANHVSDVRLFEIGTVFVAGAPGERPVEERHVAAVLTGYREPPHWTGTGGTASISGISRVNSRRQLLWRFRGARCRLKGPSGSRGMPSGKTVGAGRCGCRRMRRPGQRHFSALSWCSIPLPASGQVRGTPHNPVI